MIYKHSFLFAIAMAIVSSSALVACSSDDDNNGGGNGNNGGLLDNEEVLCMLKGDKNSATKLGEDIFIGENNIFQAIDNDPYYPHACFVSIPNVNKLGDITSVPKTGWSGKAVVKKGYGYVCYNSNDEDYFYRILVEDAVRDDDGKIVGYNIRYQYPFCGKDIDIQLPKNELSFTDDGGKEKVEFLDNEPIYFSCESSAGWCRATPTSSLYKNFLTNAVNISVDKSDTVGVSTATITLTTGYGKKKEIKVTRGAAEPRMELYGNNSSYVTSMNLPLSVSGASKSVYVNSNIPLEDIEVENTASSWCEAKLGKNSDDGYYGRYILIVTATENDTDTKRTGTITLKYRNGDTSVKLNLEQDVAYITMENGYSEENPYTFDYYYNNQYYYFKTNLSIEDIKITTSADSLTAELDDLDSNYYNYGYNRGRVYLRANSNNSSSDREDIVTISNKKGTVSCSFKVKQFGR